MTETLYPLPQLLPIPRLSLPFKPSPRKTTPRPKSLVLRVCRNDMTSGYGFKWPSVGGYVEALDWRPTRQCGAGLHGWLHGHGDYRVCGYIDPTAKWLVVEANTDEIIELDGICKFPRGKVVFVGGSKQAAAYLIAHERRAREYPVIGEHRSVGDHETAVVGALGVATAGDGGTALAGYRGVATAGYCGTATSGFRGESVAGSRGTAIAGAGGSATAKDHGTAIAGFSGKASAGEKGQISIWYWDFFERRYRMKLGYIGEEGLNPHKLYTLDEQHHFIPA